METLTIERIKEEIKDNLRRARGKSDFSSDSVLSGTGVFSKKLARIKRPIEGMLWKYGLRYAKAINRVPFLKSIAGYYYWVLAIKQVIPEAPSTLPAEESKDVGDTGPEKRP